MSSQGNDIPEGFKMTELGPLPEEWKTAQLGDAVQTLKGKKPSNLLESLQEDCVPYLTADYFRTLIPSKFAKLCSDGSVVSVNENDIVFIWDGSNAGDVFTGLRGILASTMIKILPKESDVESKYLYFFLKTQFDLFNSRTTGSTIPHVNKQLFQNLTIPLPPLPEQKAIARVLSTIQKAIEAQAKIIAAARELKKSLMRHLFTYGPVPVSQAEQVPLKETEIGPVPEHWEVVRLGEVVQKKNGIKRGPWGGSIKKEIFVPIGHKVYEQKNVIANDFSIGSYFIDDDKFEELKDFAVKDGDILITAAGTLGKLAIVPENAHKGIINQALLRLRLNEDIIIKRYFKNAFNNLVDSRILEGMSHGATLKNLSSVAVLRNLPIPLSPQTEQQEIVRILSTVDNKIDAEEKRKAALQALFKTMLHLLMTGKVRVKDLEATVA